MNPDIAIIGSLDQHTILPPFSTPVIGIPGGFALYAAAGARFWSSNVKIISRVGENYSRDWLDEFQRGGIDTSAVRVLPGYHDHRSFEGYNDHFERWIDKPISRFLDRGFEFPKELFNYRSAAEAATAITTDSPLYPKPDHIPAACQYPDAVLIGPVGYKSQFQWVNYYRSKGIVNIALVFDPTYADPREMDKIRHLVEGVEILFIHEEDLITIFRGSSITRWSMMERLAKWDIRAIVTLRPLNHQLLYLSINGDKRILPSCRSEIVDPSGHAAVFCGGFLSRYALSRDPILSAVSGNVAASVCTETTGYKPLLNTIPQLIDLRVAALHERVYKV